MFELEKAVGCEIAWKANKDLTVKQVTKVVKKGKGKTKKVTKEEPVVKGQFVYRDVELRGDGGGGGVPSGGVMAVHLDAAAFAASEVTPEEWQKGAALGEALCPSE